MISFLMPVHNIGTVNKTIWFNQAIKSIVMQDCDEIIEIVIVNDGSTDDTWNRIIDTHRFWSSTKNRRFSLLNLPKVGIARALNTAIKASGGQFLFRLDADDIAKEDRVRRQLLLFQDPNVGLVTSPARIIRENTVTDEIWWTLTSHESLVRALPRENPICHPAVAIRRSVVDKVGMYDESYEYAQDYQYWYRISKQFLLTGLSEYGTFYRLSSNRVTNRNFNQQLSCSNKIKAWIKTQEKS